jgi:hypothetical protein
LIPETLLVYPNPFNQSTTLEFSNEYQASLELIIYDMLGNRVRLVENITSNKIVIKKGNLTPGVYIIELKGASKIFRDRIMVE